MVESMEKMKKLILCFDIDNVICKTRSSSYKSSKPIKKNIKIINRLKNRGHYIKFFTSRYMGRSNENTRLAKKQGLQKTTIQLKKWNVHYNELIFGKPSYDLFIDDKCLFYKKNWSTILQKKIYKGIL